MERLAVIAFAIAALVYGVFGSPTPDHPGLTEILVVSFLLITVFAGGLGRAVWMAPWSRPFLLFLAYGLSVPFITAIAVGHTASDIGRDAIGFLAFALPLVLYGLASQRALLAGMLAVGLLFAARYVASPDILAALADNLLYLANSPLVAFAAAWLLLHGCFREEKPWRALLYVVASLLPVMAMAGMMQRATLALLACLFLAFLIVSAFKNPRRAAVIAASLGCVLAVFYTDITGLVGDLLDKTRAVGWNARSAEIAALFEVQSQNPLTALFGAGWGSVFKSPAVGDQWVRFSHSLLSSLWWKTGWLGLVLGCVAILALVRDAYGRLRHNLILFWSLVLPLLPAVFLYGSYKSLCFGLLLLGLARFDWTLEPRDVNQTARHNHTKHDHAGSPTLDSSREPRLSSDAGGDGPPSA